jgi:hypothetical protein
MFRYRFTVLLPALSAVFTSGLWLLARTDYRWFLCPPNGICPGKGWPLGWTDYTPPSIQVAGMLNVPVAFFAHPLYGLVHDPVSKWELVALLLGVVALWSYIGWRVDARNSAPRPKTALRVIAVILGCVFAFLVLVESITMFHVGLLYKVIAVFWSLLMFRHFMLLLRASPAAPQAERLSTRWRMPRITLARIAVCWAAFLVVGALALSPHNSLGKPDAALAHVFAVCGALLLLTTAYAVLVYLMTAWRTMPAASNMPSYVVWVGFETFLAIVAVAAVVYAVVRG